MKETQKTGYEQFAESASNRRLLDQESLILEATSVLSELMRAEGISRAELARRLGRSKAYVTQALRGQRNLTLRTLADLAGAVGYRVRLSARSARSGRWVCMADVPRFHAGPQGSMLLSWRGFENACPGGAPVPNEIDQPVGELRLSA